MAVDASPPPAAPPVERAAVLNALSSPLAFFGLALLVIEAPFPVLYGLSGKTVFEFWLALAVMGGLILGVVVVVMILTLLAPKSLVEKVADVASQKVIADQGAKLAAQEARLAATQAAAEAAVANIRALGASTT
jgi:hypothetical protein